MVILTISYMKIHQILRPNNYELIFCTHSTLTIQFSHAFQMGILAISF